MTRYTGRDGGGMLLAAAVMQTSAPRQGAEDRRGGTLWPLRWRRGGEAWHITALYIVTHVKNYDSAAPGGYILIIWNIKTNPYRCLLRRRYFCSPFFVNQPRAETRFCRIFWVYVKNYASVPWRLYINHLENWNSSCHSLLRRLLLFFFIIIFLFFVNQQRAEIHFCRTFSDTKSESMIPQAQRL